jgi:hypothetical protein
MNEGCRTHERGLPEVDARRPRRLQESVRIVRDIRDRVLKEATAIERRREQVAEARHYVQPPRTA